MSPESPGNLIALDLGRTSSRLEADVDRYDAGDKFLHVSWNAIEAPPNYVPIGKGVAFVWVPKGYTHRRYRARVNDVGDGFEWRDVAQASQGAMLIVTLPLNYLLSFPSDDARAQYPVDFKRTDDGRMACYWWLPPGRFSVVWHMEYRRRANVEAACRKARRAMPPAAVPVHIDRPPEEENVPSEQGPTISEPPQWHQDIQIVGVDTTPSARLKPQKTLLEQLTGTTARITALLVALTALLSQLPLVKEAAKSAYCGVLSCKSVDTGDAGSGASPTSKLLTFRDVETLDGSRSKSGLMSGIRVSIVDNRGKRPDTYVVEWTWSGSGGTQGGSQTVIIDLKSAAGATVQSLRFPLDRSHCYYPGHDERHDGTLAVSAGLVAEINVSVTFVEGPQGRC